MNPTIEFIDIVVPPPETGLLVFQIKVQLYKNIDRIDVTQVQHELVRDSAGEASLVTPQQTHRPLEIMTGLYGTITILKASANKYDKTGKKIPVLLTRVECPFKPHQELELNNTQFRGTLVVEKVTSEGITHVITKGDFFTTQSLAYEGKGAIENG